MTGGQALISAHTVRILNNRASAEGRNCRHFEEERKSRTRAQTALFMQAIKGKKEEKKGGEPPLRISPINKDTF